MKDLLNTLGTPSCNLPAQAASGTVTNTAGVDLRGFDGALIDINVGAITGTNDVTVVIQSGTSSGTVAGNFASVAAADLIGGTVGALASGAANSVVRRQYTGTHRYLRVAVTAVTGAGGLVGAVVTPVNGRHQ